MKVLLSSVVFFVSLPAFSQGPNFDENKKQILAELDKRIELIQNEKNCISSASDHDSIKACRENAKKEHDRLREEHKQMKMQKIDEKIKKLEDQKTKMQTNK